jgi:hypothetical protein
VTGTVNLHTHIAHFYVAVAWRGGAIIVRGRETEAGQIAGTLVRGTGKYVGIKGTITGQSVPHSNKTHVVVNYTL